MSHLASTDFECSLVASRDQSAAWFRVFYNFPTDRRSAFPDDECSSGGSTQSNAGYSQEETVGVNNRQRRAAKKRKRAKAGYRPGVGFDGSGRTGALDEETFAFDLVRRALEDIRANPGNAGDHARSVLAVGSAVARENVIRVLDDWLRNVISAVVRAGWTPSDLGEIVRRRLSSQHLPALAARLAGETSSHRADRVSPSWREDLTRLGPGTTADPRTPAGLETVLGLTGLLSTLPRVAEVLPPPGSAQAAAHSRLASVDSKQLSRVRALLAKAESTEYVEEAEALSAKAQELISRHALDRLILRSDEAADGEPVVARRIWIDPPYQLAKAHLIDAVASANRCRTVVSEELGFSTVVGDAMDIDSVELLSTSLLVQASTAMQRYGRQVDRRGTSRTRSFRRSFLTSYASRIGERLQAASVQAVEESGPADVLLPILRRQVRHVEEAYEAMFPELVVRETTISNSHGWAAGRAAADLALLDPHLEVTAAAR